MTVELRSGDLFAADVEALVNPVNTIGVMGKGLALRFRQNYPDVFTEYRAACRRGEVVIGRMHVVHRDTPPCCVINFPTKRHWGHRSELAFVRDGLVDLVSCVSAYGITSLAVPALGCGLGGLDWSAVQPLIVDAFAKIPHVRVLLFAPTHKESHL